MGGLNKMRKANKLDELFLKVLNWAVAALFLFMFGVVMIAVISRYVMLVPMFWPEELARYIMIYMVFLGSSIAIREEKHPTLIFIIEKFPHQLRRYWLVVIDSLIFILLAVVFWEGYLMAVDALIAKTPALRISFFWVYLSFPIGAALMMAQVLAKHIFGKKLLNEGD